MAVVIKFDSEQAHERAIDVLMDAGETYHGVASACILVSTPAVQALRASGVPFVVVNDSGRQSRGQFKK